MRCSTASAPMFTSISEETILPTAMTTCSTSKIKRASKTRGCDDGRTSTSSKTKDSSTSSRTPSKLFSKALKRIKKFTRRGSADTSKTDDMIEDDMRTSTSEMIF